MRIGKNPLRRVKGAELPTKIAFVVTHLPNQEGYHAERLEIVKLSLQSLKKHAGRPIFLLVWDNGSCEELRSWLYDFADMAIFTDNFGKENAMVSVLRMLPPDTMIAYSDDDMYFMPNWWSKLFEIYDHFPPAVVSGYPTRQGFRNFIDSTLDWAEENAEIEIENFIPDDWMEDYYRSIEQKTPMKAKYTTADVKITYREMEVFACSHHCQFLARAGDIYDIKQFSDIYTENELLTFDRPVDEKGLLRISSIERLALHMGNVLDEQFKEMAEAHRLRGRVHA